MPLLFLAVTVAAGGALAGVAVGHAAITILRAIFGAD